jgi:enoyl-[acyl-carrier-protein] reductase (NADH)
LPDPINGVNWIPTTKTGQILYVDCGYNVMGV